MIRKGLDRRTLLRGAGVAMGLPFLEAMLGQGARAQAAAIPTRLLVVYQTQGLFMDEWTPLLSGGGAPSAAEYAAGQYGVNTLSQALEPHLDDIVFVTGLSDQVAIDDPLNSNAHEAIFKELLVGDYQTGETFDGAASASVDYEISQRIYDTPPKFKSLHLGPDTPWEVCYSARNTPVSRYAGWQIGTAFDDVFGDLVSPADPEVARRRRRRQRVIDAVRESSADLSARLGAADRQRLDDYLERIGELEASITNGGFGESCAAPALSGSEAYDQLTQDYTKLATMALACNVTRVVTMAIGQPSEWPFLADPTGKEPHLLSSDWHENVVHRSWHEAPASSVEDIADARARLRTAISWGQEQLANLIASLKSVPEGDGTLLDNTLVLWVNEFGATHEHTNKPYVVAGRCGGRIQSGRWLRCEGQPHNRLLLSLLQAFVPEDDAIHGTFSNRDYCGAGPLSGLIT